MIYSSKEYKLIGYEKAADGVKKLVAILKNKKTGREVKIKFGQKGSNTYRDQTEIGGDPTHHDPKIRANYRKRHAGEGDISKKYSAGWLSYHILWVVLWFGIF